jgi:hypothetical protein
MAGSGGGRRRRRRQVVLGNQQWTQKGDKFLMSNVRERIVIDHSTSVGVS